MGPTWVLSAPGGPHVGPMNLAIRVCINLILCICLVIDYNNTFCDPTKIFDPFPKQKIIRKYVMVLTICYRLIDSLSFNMIYLGYSQPYMWPAHTGSFQRFKEISKPRDYIPPSSFSLRFDRNFSSSAAWKKNKFQAIGNFKILMTHFGISQDIARRTAGVLKRGACFTTHPGIPKRRLTLCITCRKHRQKTVSGLTNVVLRCQTIYCNHLGVELSRIKVVSCYDLRVLYFIAE